MQDTAPPTVESEIIETQAPIKKQPRKPLSKEGSSRFAQEKAMLGLLGVFIGGVIALSIIPEPYTGIVMGLITFLTLIAIFRF